MLLAENTVVAGRFRLNRLIGQGGMGSVWQATHLGLDIPCAVKFIEGEMAALPEMQMRFEREAKAAAQLRSPHVVQILDHGVCEGTPYIAMELLDGEDLGKRYAKMGHMPPAQLHHFIGQVCRALSKAHALGIVHRDLKPDNIFLVRDDDREIAKVLDFGIAKSKTSELSGSNTKTGAMLGTPYYMSPEQAQGTRALDYRSDLWSLAVITFQGLTGRLPFESEALGDLLMKIMVTDLPIPSQYGCSLPGIDNWWRKAAARDPAQRFQSAKEFADSLALVCGVSQLSGVHDRPPMMMPGPSGTLALRADGSPATQGMAAPWQPHTATTPDVARVPQGGLTPSPMSRTFADGADTGTAPKRGAGPLVAILAVAMIAIAGGLFWGLHARSGVQATAAPTPSSASAQPSAVAQPSPAATTPVMVDAGAPAAAAAPGTAAVATPSAAPAPLAPRAQVPSPPAPSKPSAPPPPKPTSPHHAAAPSDLGF
jgi:hypothetical protein